jgi:OOP family OmpA-OmpF porin
MRMNIHSTVVTLLAAVLLSACATKPYSPEPFDPVILDPSAFRSGVDSFVVILDASASMNEKHKGRRNFDYARDIVARLNETVPALDYQAGLVVFGSGRCLDGEHATRVYGMKPYQRAKFARSLDGLECASGGTHMREGIDTSNWSLVTRAGNLALIIVSDFRTTDSSDVVASVAKWKRYYGERMCVYPVQIDDNPGGRKLMKKLAQKADCGFAVNADEIVSPDAMAGYVTRVLLREVPAVIDSDSDGVSDDTDQCPGTPAGVRVNIVGCWVLADENVQFDINKAVIKDARILREAVQILVRNPGISGEIQGHTDSSGAADYNMALSLRRAHAVRDYMISAGIAPQRLRVKGYGEERPIATNETHEGRAQNRRVELHPDR